MRKSTHREGWTLYQGLRKIKRNFDRLLISSTGGQKCATNLRAAFGKNGFFAAKIQKKRPLKGA
jgi:hypothetical protein